MKEFIKYLEIKNLSKSTQKYILANVKNFIETNKTDPLNITKKEILKYIENLRNSHKQSTTINIYLRSIKYYFAFLLENQQIISNPAESIKIRGLKQRKLHNIYTTDQLATLTDDYYNIFIKNYNQKKTPKSLQKYSELCRERNYCILTFLTYQGLNTTQIQNLTLDDINLIQAIVKIGGTPKTNPRTIPLKAQQIGALINYTQNIRPKLLEHYTQETSQLFLLSSKPKYKRNADEKQENAFNHLKTQIKSINKIFYNFKQIRASVITAWIQTFGLRKAQYLAGHRYTSSTEKYMPNSIEQLTNDIEKYNPF